MRKLRPKALPKKFLNIEYSGIITRLRIDGMEDLSEIQESIKAKLSISLSHVDSPQIKLFTDGTKETLIDTWPSFVSLPEEYFLEGGSFVFISIALRREEIWIYRIWDYIMSCIPFTFEQKYNSLGTYFICTTI